MTSLADSNRNERWWTANRNIPTLGFLRLQAEEDVNHSRCDEKYQTRILQRHTTFPVKYESVRGETYADCGQLPEKCG